MSWQILRCTE
uniref:Uncharacterized protein n=1 Tax=Anguilla anguilla TaxID=7936 RepID=A0A0E9SFT0_ANGAN